MRIVEQQRLRSATEKGCCRRVVTVVGVVRAMRRASGPPQRARGVGLSRSTAAASSAQPRGRRRHCLLRAPCVRSVVPLVSNAAHHRYRARGSEGRRRATALRWLRPWKTSDSAPCYLSRSQRLQLGWAGHSGAPIARGAPGCYRSWLCAQPGAGRSSWGGGSLALGLVPSTP